LLYEIRRCQRITRPIGLSAPCTFRAPVSSGLPLGLYVSLILGACQMGFTKLDERLVQSSIMSEDPNTFKVFITLLASCGYDGIARISSTFLAAACYMPIEAIDHSLSILEAPDNRSRSLEDEGRRIRRVDGGYFIVNYDKYREHTYSNKDAATRQRKHRAKKRLLRDIPVTVVTSGDVSASASASASEIKKNLNNTVTAIFDKWNSFAEVHGLAKIKEIEKGSARESHLQNRMKKGFNFDSLLEIIGKSPFLLGKVDPKPGSARFFATFDWIIDKANYQKVIEGNYLERMRAQGEDKWITHRKELEAKK